MVAHHRLILRFLSSHILRTIFAPSMSNPFRIIALSAVLIFPILVNSACECGYVVDDQLYTDLMVTDFLNSATIPVEWQPQNYTVPQTESRGPYGKVASPDNIVINPLKRNGARGSDAGLQMIVRGGIPRGEFIPMAELATVRNDFLYGSFRAGMKHTGVPGTCSTIFWVCKKETKSIYQARELVFQLANMNFSTVP